VQHDSTPYDVIADATSIVNAMPVLPADMSTQALLGRARELGMLVLCLPGVALHIWTIRDGAEAVTVETELLRRQADVERIELASQLTDAECERLAQMRRDWRSLNEA
jgi:hypothetical protein